MLKINSLELKAFFLTIVLTGASCLSLVSMSLGATKTLIDYFLPMPIVKPLKSDKWGCAAVGKRDIYNGLEDSTMKSFCYWDGPIIKGPDDKYHMFASRWDQSGGHWSWTGSVAVHAVSDSIMGPYSDKGTCWPTNQGGKGHNVTILQLKDGTYASVVSDTRPGDFFTAPSLNGPWTFAGSIKVTANGFPSPQLANLSIIIRPDNGYYEIVPRNGQIMISSSGLTGPYVVQGNSVYNTINLPDLEDPVLWYSGGVYHIVVNSWSERKAYHLTSLDGIKNWSNKGLAFDPTSNFLRYTDGTVNHWNKIERPGVVIEDGHITHFTFAVIDVEKDKDLGNDTHGSKVIVVPFNGAAMDQTTTAAIPGIAPKNGQKSVPDVVRISYLHNNSASINVPYQSIYEMRIMLANGKTIKIIRANKATTFTFSRQDLKVGVYFVTIVGNKDKLSKTMVIY